MPARRKLTAAKLIVLLITLCVAFAVFLSFYNPKLNKSNLLSRFHKLPNLSVNATIILPDNVVKAQIIPNQTKNVVEYDENVDVSYHVHIFYYPWYGNPDIDGHYFHWNHEYMPHWDKKKARKFKTGRHVPPDDIGANFYPQLGAYSSRSREVIDAHMKQIKRAGVGVVAVSWYPKGTTDQSDASEPDSIIPIMLDAADKYKLKVTLHVEPYKDRNIKNLRENFRYIREKYFHHNAFYKHKVGNKLRPLLYIYDSYLIVPQEWRKLFDKSSDLCIRDNDNYDVTAVALLVDEKHKESVRSGFDGFYTYFGSIGFSYGSTWRNWNNLATYARNQHLIFIPSVAPGYLDTMVRPWNRKTTRKRKEGEYYNLMWQAAIRTPSKFVSITSFNEWHEGTQIEPAVPKQIPNFKYQDYLPHDPNYYLDLTRNWVEKFIRSREL